jgi:nucleoside-diphosphate-sugar epimerase
VRALILGGTVFLSKAVAREYLSRGHDVTCLARDVEAHVPAGARAVSADRSQGVRAYEDVTGPWDCVVDVATDPTFVREALNVLASRTRHWTYVSSCSVYVDQNTPGCDEDQPIFSALDEGKAPSLEAYGASKSACEAWCRDALEDRLLVVRPGLIVGAGDPSDRGGYWPARFVRGDGPVLVPAAQDLYAQMIDVRDLAAWMAASGETALSATLNAVGDSQPLSSVLADIRHAVDHGGDVVAAADQWLLDHGVAPWAGDESLPLWIPRERGFDGFSRRSNDAARRQGLVLRPLAETVRDVRVFEESRGVNRSRRAGLSAARERELLEALAHGH